MPIWPGSACRESRSVDSWRTLHCPAAHRVPIYAPAGTPPAVVARLNQEINRILALPGPRERIAALGGDPAPMTPAQFHERAVDDGKRFGKIIRERKIVGD